MHSNFCTGQIQMLQQAKERLEMVGEQNRRQYVKDIEGKEEEIQEIRASYQKKVKELFDCVYCFVLSNS